MDAPAPDFSPTGQPADAAAEKLRALRARADAALGAQRNQLGSIEAELSAWVEKLAAEYGGAEAPGTPSAQEVIALSQSRVRLAAAEQYASLLEKQLTKEISERQSQLAQRDQEKTLLERQLQELARQVSAAKTSGGINAEQLQATHRELSTALAALRDELTGLEEQLDAQQAETEAAQSSVSEMERRLAESKQEVDDLQSERNSLELHCEELRSLLAARNGEQSATSETTSRLQSELAAARRELAELRASTVPRKECERQLAASEAADAARTAAERQVEEVVAERDRLSAELSVANEALAAAKARQEEIVAECDRLLADAQRGAQNASSAVAAKGQLETQLAEAQAALAASQDQLASEAKRSQQLAGELSHLQATTVSREEFERVQALLADANDSRVKSHDAGAAAQATLTAERDAALAEQQRLALQVAEGQRQLAELKQNHDAILGELADVRRAAADQKAGSVSRADFETQAKKLAELAAESQTRKEELSACRDEVARVQAELAVALAAAEGAEAATTLAESLSSTEKQLESAEAYRDALSAERDALRTELAVWKGDFEALRAQYEQSGTERQETAEQLAAAQAEAQEAAAALVAAQQKYEEFAAKVVPADEHADVQQRLSATCADLASLGQELAELREAAASQPVPSFADAPEFLALQAERDDLAARVQELEAEANASVSEEAAEQIADLRRRHEMTLDDLRAAKEEVAELRKQAAAAPSPGSVKPTLTFDGPQDWASQKERLLAMLEDEDASGAPKSPDRKAERAKIDDAIAATEAALAAKDRELTRLRTELDEARDAAPSVDAQEAALAELFDADEAIQVERERLQILQEQWNEKLRQAELEISVQRAALAREQAALRDKQEEVERMRGAQADPILGNDGKPKRRWLSALGLGDEEKQGDGGK